MELLKEKVSQVHPCFRGCGAAGNGRNYGRIHLPVCSGCNIQCRFCRRAFNGGEDRPGVARGLLDPREAVETVARALRLCPEITVIGIAGPGDTLATGEAMETFEAVHRAYPDLLMCMSTNGLLLPEYAGTLRDLGVHSITVTMNAVDPDLLFRIVSRVSYGGRTYGDEEGARILIENQLRGIHLASEFAVVKVNTVLIPGLNDGHIPEVAAAAASAGASIYNIIPLIPQHEFRDYPAPDCDTLDRARRAAELSLPVFRHCQHCRADACGIPGISDYTNRLYEGTLDDSAGSSTLSPALRPVLEETFSHG
jgi:nitrogen fixation protein NifB